MLSKTKEYRAIYWQSWRSKNKPKIIKVCIKCLGEFASIGGTKYCEECRSIKCAFCGDLFKPSHRGKKYCSKNCHNKSMIGVEPDGLKNKRGVKPRTYHLRERDKHGNVFDREWRIAVFKRDGYTCQSCNKKGGMLQAHHIKPFKKFPDLRWDVSNGLTLCIDCHKKTDTYGWSNYWKTQIAAQRMQQEVLQF